MNRQKRSREVQLIPTTTENKFIVVEINYNEGGINYWSYTTDKRGFYVRVAPEERTGGWRKFDVGSGYKHLLEEVPRYNARRLAELTVPPEILNKMIGAVLANSGLQLKGVAA